jgi:hypothetical protein
MARSFLRSVYRKSESDVGDDLDFSPAAQFKVRHTLHALKLEAKASQSKKQLLFLSVLWNLMDGDISNPRLTPQHSPKECVESPHLLGLMKIRVTAQFAHEVRLFVPVASSDSN